jgi:hypothetical protein
MLTKLTLSERPNSAATSAKSGACWVQAIVSGPPSAMSLRMRSSSMPQNWSPDSTRAEGQARATASPKSGIVRSQEQTATRLVSKLIRTPSVRLSPQR